MKYIETPRYMLIRDNSAIWLQTNRLFGNTVPELSDDGAANRARAQALLGSYSVAGEVVRMKPGDKAFIDIGRHEPRGTQHTEGVVTSNPEHILHANPADCGEVAVRGFGVRGGRPVIGLLHASRRSIQRRTYLDAMDYIAESYGVEPDKMSIILSPSAKRQSYVFEKIEPAQVQSTFWANYVQQDDRGMWHVDLHQKLIDDIISFGVMPDKIYDTDIDTISDDRYFSYYRHKKNNETLGGNGVMFALHPSEGS